MPHLGRHPLRLVQLVAAGRAAHELTVAMCVLLLVLTRVLHAVLRHRLVPKRLGTLQ